MAWEIQWVVNCVGMPVCVCLFKNHQVFFRAVFGFCLAACLLVPISEKKTMMQISAGLFSTGQPEDEERPPGLERGPSTHQLQGSLPTPQGSGKNYLHAKINLARYGYLCQQGSSKDGSFQYMYSQMQRHFTFLCNLLICILSLGRQNISKCQIRAKETEESLIFCWFVMNFFVYFLGVL